MKFLDTIHKKKSAVITFMMGVLLFYMFFVLGLTYIDPPVSYGMEIDFVGVSDKSGNSQSQKSIDSKSNSSGENSKLKELNKNNFDIEKKKSLMTEKQSTIVIPRKKEVSGGIEPQLKDNKKEKEIFSTKETQKVSEQTKKLVSNLVKKNYQTINDNQVEKSPKRLVTKEKLLKNQYGNSYYNSGGFNEKAMGFGLNGRVLKSNGKVIQECNQEGIVVVRIIVNQQGNIVNAEPGVKGSTNTHPCLLSPAKKTAMLHKWYPDSQAPAKQTGFVVIQFKLGE